MVGQNLDMIQTMTVRRDGQIVILDNDGVNTLGVQISGSEVAVIDSITGRAPIGTEDEPYIPKVVHDIDTPSLRMTVWGMDYGDLYFDGSEQIYAFATTHGWDSIGETIMGVLDPETGAFDPVGSGTFDIGAGVRAMAFSPQAGSFDDAGRPLQGLYAIGTDNNLYEVNPLDPSDWILLGAVQQQQFDAAGNPVLDDEGEPVFDSILISSMDFDENGDLFGHDPERGRLVDIALDGAVGDRTDTAPGTLRPTVGGLSYDYANDRWLAMDNSFSYAVSIEGGAAFLGELTADEETMLDMRIADSSLLMEVIGTETDSPEPQTMDKVLIGGTLTGSVNFSGSVDTLYAGWLLTGDTGGVALDVEAVNSDNFVVAGDLRNLLVQDSIGGSAAADYFTDTEFRVQGKTGWVWTQNTFLGEVYAENHEGIGNMPWLTSPQEEIAVLATAPDPRFQFESFELPRTLGWLANSSYYSPQYLGSLRNGVLGRPDMVQLSGTHDGGYSSDFYALGLTAGQTITVQLEDSADALGIFVYDPLGRIIASNVSSLDMMAVIGEPLQITTELPGIYRFEVRDYPHLDTNYNPNYAYGYEITIRNVGDLGIGALTVGYPQAGGGALYNPYAAPLVDLSQGSIGVIGAGWDYYNAAPVSVSVASGDLRVVTAGGMGTPTFSVPNGDIGLIENTALGALVDLYMYADLGGDVQGIYSAANLWMMVNAGGGIGVIRTAQFTTHVGGPALVDYQPSVINLNVDNTGDDGIIDLIDVTGDLGTLNAGGPWIDTGDGGNVRFMRVGGEVYVDRQFMWSEPSRRQLDPGVTARLRDDSGGWMTITPLVDTVDPIYGSPVNVPALDYWFYPIRNSGGGVVIEVRSTGGIRIDADSHNNGAPVEIGRIEVLGAGRDVLVDPTTFDLSLAPDVGSNLNVLLAGTGADPIDVFEVSGGSWAGGTGNFTTISNTTGGDLVCVYADTIGTLYSKGSIGVVSGQVVPGIPTLGVGAGYAGAPAAAAGVNQYVFNQPGIGVVAQQIITVQAEGALGNFILTGGSTAEGGSNIGSMEANYRGTVDHTDGHFDGIVAPIYLTGELRHLQIGEGIAPSGTGEFARSGLFADASYDSSLVPQSRGAITEIVNQGPGSDIRGDIFSMGGVRRIRLNGGSILDADISTFMSFDPSVEWNYGGQFLQSTSTAGFDVNPDIDKVTITGPGGIIGLESIV